MNWQKFNLGLIIAGTEYVKRNVGRRFGTLNIAQGSDSDVEESIRIALMDIGYISSSSGPSMEPAHVKKVILRWSMN